MADLTTALVGLLDSRPVGVLATERPGGRPSQSVVYYVRDDERLLISSVEGRRKVRDVGRSGWASLSVMAAERPFASATFSGSAEILRREIGPATAAIAKRIMGSGEQPEEQSDEALAAVGRVIIALAVESVTAINYLDG